MTFHVQYPLIFIRKGDDYAIVDGKDGGQSVNAFPVFNDKEGAEDFRAQFYPGWQFGAIPDETFFARLLLLVGERLSLVAFDPYRMGKRVATISIDHLLSQFGQDD